MHSDWIPNIQSIMESSGWCSLCPPDVLQLPCVLSVFESESPVIQSASCCNQILNVCSSQGPGAKSTAEWCAQPEDPCFQELNNWWSDRKMLSHDVNSCSTVNLIQAGVATNYFLVNFKIWTISRYTTISDGFYTLNTNYYSRWKSLQFHFQVMSFND